MPFVDHRGAGRAPGLAGRTGGPGPLHLAVAMAALQALAPSFARAAPLDEPFVGGLSFSGPTSANLTSIYWNPAALGLVRGTQLMIAGSGRIASTTVSRASIDPANPGAPGGAFSPGAATAHDVTQPVQWPIGPGSFMGISSDLGGDRFTLGFATYMPYLQQTRFPTSLLGTEPTRYQALEVDLRNLALVPALSLRLAGDFRVGFAPGFMFSTGRLRFAEDTGLTGACGGAPCPAENPATDARYDVNSGQGLGDATFSVTLGGGVYYRRRNFEFGLSYSSRPIGGLAGVEVTAERTLVTPPMSASPVTCNGQAGRCVFGDIGYRLPDVWIGGVTWHFRPGFELSVMARWLWFHLHDRIDLRLTGPTLQAAGVPEHVVLYRGFHDVWDLRGRVSYWWHERLRVGVELRLETSAVDTNAVNAAAVDGDKVEPIVLAELRLTRHLWLGAGYGLTLMSQVDVTSSVFDPRLAVTCANAHGDLTNPACRARLEGQARPTAAGTYRRTVQDFGITMTAKF